MSLKNEGNYFCLFSCCIIVEGHKQSALCDVQRGDFILLTQEQTHLLQQTAGASLAKLSTKYDQDSYENILNFFEALVHKDFGFYTNKAKQFPPINLDWDAPASITNAIIDLASPPNSKLIKTLEEICSVGCAALQLRFFYPVEPQALITLLTVTNNSRIQSIEIFVPSQSAFDHVNEVQKMIDTHPRITQFVIFNSVKQEVINYRGFPVIYLNASLEAKQHCGMVTQDLFILNIKSFTEFRHHNACLNRKISIDTDGNIKNCPSMSQSFGNIEDTTLQKALAHPDLKKYWNITKDQISVCKDCEFRYICTDCRAYIEHPEDIYSKPLKCGYNPYTCVWEEWSTNPLKQQAIDYYGMREVLPEFNLKPDYVPT